MRREGGVDGRESGLEMEIRGKEGGGRLTKRGEQERRGRRTESGRNRGRTERPSR